MKPLQLIISSLCFYLALNSGAQVLKKRNYAPIWTFHQDSINIHGISLGLWSINDKPRFTNTNGIKFELIGIGLFIPLIPHSPIVETDSQFLSLQNEPLSEKINGLNLSTSGTVCHCLTNGLSAGFIGQINFQVNGLSAALYLNFSQKHQGVMVALFNDAYVMNGLQVGLSNNAHKTRGVQIGLFNNSKHFKGIQIGLWNVNQKRKLPFINWNFR